MTTSVRDDADTAGRPALIKGDSQILFGSMGRLLKTRSSI